MKERLRKPLLFLVIVVVGSVLVLIDIPLTILLPLLLIVGFGTLLALGSITVAEIRSGIAGLGKTGILRRLNDISFLKKAPAGAKQVAPPVVVKKGAGAEKTNEGEAKPGLAGHFSAFFSSLGSLGSVLRQKSRQEKKVEDIDKLLDKTVSEKVPAPASPAGSGGAAGKGLDMDDPFMSLSGDEFDEGLLEGLGEDDGLVSSAPAPAEEVVFNPADFPDLEPADTDLPVPVPAVSAAGEEAGGNAGGGLEEFSGLDGGDLSDADFGDLDNLSLDDIEPDAGSQSGQTAASAGEDAAPETPSGTAAAAALPSGSNAVKTAWIPSDAPKDAGESEDEVSTQADMAAFAGGAGGDEDLLSSIASDVKHTKKEQDISLLRELKDFRAPAAEIEQELSGMYERMSMGNPAKKKDPSGTKGRKQVQEQ